MPYAVRLAPPVVRALRKETDRDLVRRLVRAMDALATTPRPRGVRKLEGEEDLWRIPPHPHRVRYDAS
jgi:mRNA interferase RelE/StbE